MTDPVVPNPQRETEESSREERHEARKRVIRFVSIFAVAVLTLLTAYRYAVPTVGNDWYLFQVARHTSWMLRFVGHSSSVENPGRIKEDPALVRAALDGWRNGQEPPESPSETTALQSPLTPWEIYRYRMLRARTDNANAKDSGPFVSFVLTAGLPLRIRETEEQLEQVETDSTLDEAVRSQRRGELQARLAQLTAEEKAAKEQSPPPDSLRDRMFPFTVVPDCGAVPSMSIFFAAVLAFPTRWWKRLVGAMVGVPVLYLVNCFRLACLAVIGAWDYSAGYGGKWFTFAHEYVWQGVYIVFVVAVWVLWVEFVVRKSDKWERAANSGG
jgi:exosortase/archaeosortase family protein